METGNAHRLLIVDDEENIRRLLTLFWREKGLEVIAVADGWEALGELAAHPFDLVLTDVNMPGMDGLALLREIRERYPDTGVLVLTGYGTIQDAVYAMKHGALDFVTKPLDMAELESKVSAHLADLSRARQVAKTSQEAFSVEPLVELSRILADQTDLSEIVEQTVNLVRHVFQPMGTRMILFDEHLEQGFLAIQTGRGFEGVFLPPTKAEIEALTRRARPWLERRADVSLRHLACLTVPLEAGKSVMGALSLVRGKAFTQGEIGLLQVFGVQLGMALLHGQTRRHLQDLFQNLQQVSFAAVETLFEALRVYDEYTHEHSRRVSHFARILGERVGLGDNELEMLSVAALLHDVGKLGVGDATLRKAHELTLDELGRIRLHPDMGARILHGLDAFADIVPLVRHHHERYDGQGYPDGLAGEAIPRGARIIAVVDAFDSMIFDRPYRSALAIDEACQRLRQAAGNQLDPELVEQWLEILAMDASAVIAELFPT
ncbi:MAG: response regulator [Chloroflexi bacterium]|nr:response regulator [Chloroflexota bacterium]